jgi:hypothetical protein
LLSTALAVVGVASPSAQARVLQVNGERTTIMTTAVRAQFLATNDIAVATTGNATTGADGSLILPITHGSVSQNMDGHVYHSGGVAFSHGGRSLNYRDFELVPDRGVT